MRVVVLPLAILDVLGLPTPEWIGSENESDIHDGHEEHEEKKKEIVDPRAMVANRSATIARGFYLRYGYPQEALLKDFFCAPGDDKVI